MKVITKQSLIDNLPERWFNGYGLKDTRSNFRLANNKMALDIYNELIENKPLTEEKIIKIIGHASWITEYCNECNKPNDYIIEIGQEPDYDSATAKMCINCLNKAVKELSSKINDGL